MIGCRADGLRSLRERYAVVARRACEKPISRAGKGLINNISCEVLSGPYLVSLLPSTSHAHVLFGKRNSESLGSALVSACYMCGLYDD